VTSSSRNAIKGIVLNSTKRTCAWRCQWFHRHCSPNRAPNTHRWKCGNPAACIRQTENCLQSSDNYHIGFLFYSKSTFCVYRPTIFYLPTTPLPLSYLSVVVAFGMHLRPHSHKFTLMSFLVLDSDNSSTGDIYLCLPFITSIMPPVSYWEWFWSRLDLRIAVCPGHKKNRTFQYVFSLKKTSKGGIFLRRAIQKKPRCEQSASNLMKPKEFQFHCTSLVKL
jgi:hypothetical protein